VFDAVVVSDVHCDGPASPTQRAFLGFLARVRTRRLVLAGDIFHAFGQPRGTPFAAYQPVLDALADFDTVVLPGNHDWAHAGAAGTGAAVGTRCSLRLGALLTEVSHGDEVDVSARYRAFHTLLRGRGFALLLDRIGAERAWNLLHRLAGALGDGAPDPALVAAQHTLAAQRWQLGVELVVMGHTHAPECTIGPAGRFLNPGDWVRHRTYGVVEGDHVTLRRFDDDGGSGPIGG
jgi:UDP-2,3-diacylglucosamine pyrophosphatase LpxH